MFQLDELKHFKIIGTYTIDCYFQLQESTSRIVCLKHCGCKIPKKNSLDEELWVLINGLLGGLGQKGDLWRAQIEAQHFTIFPKHQTLLSAILRENDVFIY